MQGTLAEFTLAQLLQFMAIAERSGTITVRAGKRVSRLLVDGDRVSGWGFDDYDLLASIAQCELLPAPVRSSLAAVVRRTDTPGLSAVVSNLIEPARWSTFVERVLEQEVYPILNAADGDFEIQVGPCPPAPLRFSLQVNSLILDGSRWESETEAAEQAGLSATSKWKRSGIIPADGAALEAAQLMIWSVLREPRMIAELSQSLCLPDLTAMTAIRRLNQLGLVMPATDTGNEFAEDATG
jgi:hypothetical protein